MVPRRGLTVPRSVAILSDKSSGSTFLQRSLARHPDVRLLPHTPHQENETLFWSKATAALGLPQAAMAESRVVPMSLDAGVRGLHRLAADNLGAVPGGPLGESWVFGLWDALATAYGPVLVEKSPHHLHAAATLGLMRRYRESRGAQALQLVGLVRNPMATLYSMWTRWALVPERRQHEWVRAYENLLRLESELDGGLLIVRYEDLVGDLSGEVLAGVLTRVGLEPSAIATTREVSRLDSVQRWQTDMSFGFRPSPAVLALGERLGYPAADMTPRGARRGWGLRRRSRVTLRSARRLVAPVVRGVRR